MGHKIYIHEPSNKIHNFLQLQQQDKNIDTLSMGMSSDYELAIAHGATMVRLGTALFGKRKEKT